MRVDYNLLCSLYGYKQRKKFSTTDMSVFNSITEECTRLKVTPRFYMAVAFERAHRAPLVGTMFSQDCRVAVLRKIEQLQREGYDTDICHVSRPIAIWELITADMHKLELYREQNDGCPLCASIVAHATISDYWASCDPYMMRLIAMRYKSDVEGLRRSRIQMAVNELSQKDMLKLRKMIKKSVRNWYRGISGGRTLSV